MTVVPSLGRLGLMAVSTVAAVTVGFLLFSPPDGLQVMRHAGYFFIAVSTAAFCGAALRLWLDPAARLTFDRADRIERLLKEIKDES